MTNTQIQEQSKILVPKRIITNLEGKEFYNNSVPEALKSLQKEGYTPVYMPQLADARIEADGDSRVWQTWFTTPSIRATGRTKQGNPVVVYAHTNNYLSTPENIEQAISEGLVNNAGRIPQGEFQRLVDLEGLTDESGNKLVFLVDYDKFRNSPSGLINVSDALEHPQVIPFLGGEERAQRYLEKHKTVFGPRIGVWYTDDLRDEPLARLLYLGDYDDGLGGLNYLGYGARFLGVRDSAEGASSKIPKPSIDQVLKIAEDYLGRASLRDFTERVHKLSK
ncbi:hypothetical protein J4455_01565 [Candidatus Woesearchaeota archaeon]|nr:hypothetical protein [uncultured archaeon]AQS32247.1 hypothetical protein [uncultured archaeon]MBS3149366.1 hypothetical protein [Candidatus Woesearchaeota archaeon]